jgi:hypothetical protein
MAKPIAAKSSSYYLILIISAFIITRVLCFILIDNGWSDIPIYNAYAEKITNGQVPYVDFKAEYPPIALILFIIPSLLAKLITNYADAYRLMMMLFDIGCVCLIWQLAKNLGKPGSRQIYLSILAYILLTGIMFQVLYDRFDIAVSFMILFGIYLAVIRNNWLAAYCVLYLATLTKVFPIIIIPLIVIMQFKITKNIKTVLKDIIISTTAFAIGIIIISVWVGKWWTLVLSYHGSRGIQIESLYGCIALVTSYFGYPYTYDHNFGSFNIVNSFTPFMAILASVLTTFALLTIYYLFARSFSKKRLHEDFGISLLKTVLALLLAFVTFNKVLSPQYLLWLLPLAALALWNNQNRSLLLFLWFAATITTATYFPYNYQDIVLVKGNGVALLTARNFALVVLAYLSVIELTRPKLPQTR